MAAWEGRGEEEEEEAEDSALSGVLLGRWVVCLLLLQALATLLAQWWHDQRAKLGGTHIHCRHCIAKQLQSSLYIND